MKGQPAINGYIDEEEHLRVPDDDERLVMQIVSIDTITL
jgi:hypothetical protein